MVFTIGRRWVRARLGIGPATSLPGRHRSWGLAAEWAEPILHQGTVRTIEWDDKWTHVSEDGGRSAQFEHMVLITPTGHEVLT